MMTPLQQIVHQASRGISAILRDDAHTAEDALNTILTTAQVLVGQADKAVTATTMPRLTDLLDTAIELTHVVQREIKAKCEHEALSQATILRNHLLKIVKGLEPKAENHLMDHFSNGGPVGRALGKEPAPDAKLPAGIDAAVADLQHWFAAHVMHGPQKDKATMNFKLIVEHLATQQRQVRIAVMAADAADENAHKSKEAALVAGRMLTDAEIALKEEQETVRKTNSLLERTEHDFREYVKASEAAIKAANESTFKWAETLALKTAEFSALEKRFDEHLRLHRDMAANFEATGDTIVEYEATQQQSLAKITELNNQLLEVSAERNTLRNDLGNTINARNHFERDLQCLQIAHARMEADFAIKVSELSDEMVALKVDLGNAERDRAMALKDLEREMRLNALHEDRAKVLAHRIARLETYLPLVKEHMPKWRLGEANGFYQIQVNEDHPEAFKTDWEAYLHVRDQVAQGSKCPKATLEAWSMHGNPLPKVEAKQVEHPQKDDFMDILKDL